MAMAADEIKGMIKAALPDAVVEITDLAGDGNHYAARVVSESFRGLPRVKQHKTVYDALDGKMGGVLHALQLTTATP
jgi:stress-induced morphogen